MEPTDLLDTEPSLVADHDTEKPILPIQPPTPMPVAQPVIPEHPQKTPPPAATSHNNATQQQQVINLPPWCEAGYSGTMPAVYDQVVEACKKYVFEITKWLIN